MSVRLTLLTLWCLFLASCNNRKAEQEITVTPTPIQQKMLDEGWTIEEPDEDLSEDYGIKPVFGLQDNYFDITIGNGCNVAVKIMDSHTEECIRYICVSENTTTTVHEIPQGTYYLKLAYGYDWMVLDTGKGKRGKFTRKVSYERSQDVFDFGSKNSKEEVNYSLEINVIDSKLENNFPTRPISEEEFME